MSEFTKKDVGKAIADLAPALKQRVPDVSIIKIWTDRLTKNYEPRVIIQACGILETSSKRPYEDYTLAGIMDACQRIRLREQQAEYKTVEPEVDVIDHMSGSKDPWVRYGSWLARSAARLTRKEFKALCDEWSADVNYNKKKRAQKWKKLLEEKCNSQTEATIAQNE